MYINNLWMTKGKSPDDMLYLMYGILFIAPSNAMSSDACCHVLHQVLQFSGGVPRGPETIFCLTPGILSANLSNKTRLLNILVKPWQKGCNFQFKMHNIQHSLDNVSNIYWIKC